MATGQLGAVANLANNMFTFSFAYPVLIPKKQVEDQNFLDTLPETGKRIQDKHSSIELLYIF
jgi:hypothetical protein